MCAHVRIPIYVYVYTVYTYIYIQHLSDGDTYIYIHMYIDTYKTERQEREREGAFGCGVGRQDLTCSWLCASKRESERECVCVGVCVCVQSTCLIIQDRSLNTQQQHLFGNPFKALSSLTMATPRIISSGVPKGLQNAVDLGSLGVGGLFGVWVHVVLDFRTYPT